MSRENNISYFRKLIYYFKSLGYLVSKTYVFSSIASIRIFWGEKTLWNKIKYLLF